MYVADKTLSPENLMLEASFTRLVNLFDTYQRATNEEILRLHSQIEQKQEAIEIAELQYQTLIESLKNVTVLPDEHVWAQKISYLRQTVSELLHEALDFTAYANERLSVYDQIKK